MIILTPTCDYIDGVEVILSSTKSSHQVLISDNSKTKDIEILCKKYNHVQYFYNPPKGYVDNFNNLLLMTRNKFVCLIADNEFINSSDLQKLNLINFKNDTVYFMNFEVTKNSKVLNKGLPIIFKKILIHFFPKILLFFNFIGPTASYIYYNSQEQYYDSYLKWYVDTDFLYRIIKSKKFEFLNIVVNSPIKLNSLTDNLENKFIISIKESFYLKKKYHINYLEFVFCFCLSIFFRVILKIINISRNFL